MLTFSALAVTVRWVGAVLRAGGPPWMQLPGWLLCLSASWLAVGLFGVAFPLWPVIPVGVAGFVLHLWVPRLLWIAAAELALFIWIAAWAVPIPTWVALGVLLGGVALVWTGFEVGARLLPAPSAP